MNIRTNEKFKPGQLVYAIKDPTYEPHLYMPPTYGPFTVNVITGHFTIKYWECEDNSVNIFSYVYALFDENNKYYIGTFSECFVFATVGECERFLAIMKLEKEKGRT